MAFEGFLDRNQQPDSDQISKMIGRETLPVWQDVVDYLDKHFPDYESELIYYNTQKGWAIRYRKEAQSICTLFPERGRFTALVTLDPKEEEEAMAVINFFNARLRELLSRPSSIPQGRWLWMPLEDHTDFVGFKLLMDIKSA